MSRGIQSSAKTGGVKHSHIGHIRRASSGGCGPFRAQASTSLAAPLGLGSGAWLVGVGCGPGVGEARLGAAGVFYNGGGANNQVLSDFSYNTNTDPTTSESITRSFSGIRSVGGPASLTLAGPDGQSNFGKIFTFTGSSEFTVTNPFNGGAPQEGPSFPIGNLWDDEIFDVSSILPPGQQTLTFNNLRTEDCIGVGAAVLQVAQ